MTARLRAILIGLLLVAVASSRTASNTEQAPSTKPDPAVEAAVMQVLKDYMDAFNRLDVVSWERTFHFPHYRLASGQMSILDHPGQQTAERIRASLGPDWDHSRWGRLRIIHSSPDKVHVDTLFVRYRKDDSIIGSFESLYVVTKEQGRWGVKLRSSMAP
jgi:hypothetical protein